MKAWGGGEFRGLPRVKLEIIRIITRIMILKMQQLLSHLRKKYGWNTQITHISFLELP